MTRYAGDIIIASLLAAALCGSLVVAMNHQDEDLEQFHVVYEWYKLDYAWPDDASKLDALASRRYQPENNVVSGVKAHRDRLYLTLPRYRHGVPATLVTVAATNARDRNASPRLEAYPSWSMQQVGNCSALQFVQNVEIDTLDRMWVLDTGRVGTMMADTNTSNRCPAKLVLIDMAAGNGSVTRTFQFPPEVVDPETGYLADLVLDPTDGWYAYISDAGDADPGLVVYSLVENRAWKVRDVDGRSMRADPSVRKFTVTDGTAGGRPAEILQNVSPLAVDLRTATLYYSPLTSLEMYAMPTATLRDASRGRADVASARSVGKKLGLSGGFAMDARGVLYYGLIDESGVARWDTDNKDDQRVIAKDPVRLQWPTGFGFDETGHLWLVSNRLHNYIAGRVNLSEANCRVIRGLTGTRSYLYAERNTTDTPDNNNNTSRYSSNSNGSVATTTTSLTLLLLTLVVAMNLA